MDQVSVFASLRLRHLCRTLPALACFLLLLPRSAQSQELSERARADQSLRAIDSGSVTSADVENVANVHETQAIPGLEKQFEAEHDLIKRGSVAQGLVRLGATNPRYFDFLVKLARPVLEGNIPNLYTLNPDGSDSTTPSPALLAWAKERDLSIDAAAQQIIFGDVVKVLLLAGADDPRAIPLLRKGLASPNLLIQASAAKGLADVNDTPSVPAIIAACDHAPNSFKEEIASALPFFNDARARLAAERYLSPVRAEHLRAAVAHGGSALRPDVPVLKQ